MSVTCHFKRKQKRNKKTTKNPQKTKKKRSELLIAVLEKLLKIQA